MPFYKLNASTFWISTFKIIILFHDIVFMVTSLMRTIFAQFFLIRTKFVFHISLDSLPFDLMIINFRGMLFFLQILSTAYKATTTTLWIMLINNFKGDIQ